MAILLPAFFEFKKKQFISFGYQVGAIRIVIRKTTYKWVIAFLQVTWDMGLAKNKQE